MRKRKHFWLNSKNAFFDRFYISNYSNSDVSGCEVNDRIYDDELACQFDEWIEIENGFKWLIYRTYSMPILRNAIRISRGV
jgi:hypothetical protein